MSNAEKILQVLKDKKPHYSSEFRDKCSVLEYRGRVTDLRRRGYIIKQFDKWVRLGDKMIRRSLYQMVG